MNNLKLQEAEGIILGCAEIGLLVKQQVIDIALSDTTYIHDQKQHSLLWIKIK